MSQVDVKKAFYMEPEEIVKYFESKGLKTSYDWREIYEEAHAKSFTVAKMMNADLLNDTHDMLTKAIKEGWSAGHFQKEAGELFKKKGWDGIREVKNPKTGEVETVELGTPRRIKNIFKNNINSAYAVGRYKQQLEDVDIAPYFQYMCILDEATRPEHKAMHEKVFRYDDPIWESLYPPNGWGCRCFVRSLSENELKNLELKVEKSGSALQEIDTGDIRPVAGYSFKVGNQDYTLQADAGWSTNLGAHAWNIDLSAYRKIEKLPQELKDTFISQMAQNIYSKEAIVNLIKKTINNNLNSRGLEQTLTWFSPKIIQALENENIRLQTPIAVFEDRQVKHSLSPRKVETQRLTKEQFLRIYDMVADYDEVYIDTQAHAVVYLKYLSKDEIVDGRDCIKIPVVINSQDKRRPVNYISTTGRISSKNIKTDKRYKKIE